MQNWMNKLLSFPGRLLVKFITQETSAYTTFSVHDTATLNRIMEPGDVLLVEGNLWLSGAIKYLTQSTWSHSAMYVGNIIDPESDQSDPKVLIEADIKLGVVGVSLSKYQHLNIRICRPIGLTADDKHKVINYMMKHLGNSYDLKNIVDLARYLLPTPPVPRRFRQRLIALGSGDPTRAICSSLIAQAFQSVKYPILPVKNGEPSVSDVYQIRHHTLFTPRDFDSSPYFDIIKPTLKLGFDYQSFSWMEPPEQ
jgi:hypothetical protein